MKPTTKLITLNDLMARAGHYAHHCMQNLGCMLPTFFWTGTQGTMFCLLGSMSTLEDKVACVDLARLICLAHRATACITATESWVVLARPGEKLDLTERPSESLDRIEAVMLMGESREQQCHTLLKIVRSDNGKFFGLSKLPLPRATHKMRGRFTRFIQPDFPDNDAQLQAQAKLKKLDVKFHRLS